MHICTLTLYGNKAIDQAQYIVYTMNSRELYTLKKVLIRTATISRYYVIIKRGQVTDMRIIKRSGAEVDFDISKIIAAIYKANAVVGEDDKLKKAQVDRIANTVENQCMSMNRAMSVEEIQVMVEDGSMRENGYEVAR